jgi:hypothetical protein
VTRLAFGVPGAEGTGLGSSVRGTESIGGIESKLDGAGAGEIVGEADRDRGG